MEGRNGVSKFMNKFADKLKDKCNIAFLVIAIIGFCAFQGYYSNQFTYDDGYLTERFALMINEDGVFKTIFKEFLNMDLARSGELRFYGLSKAIHVILYLLVGEHTGVYQFIMTGAHFAAGILLYKIVDFFRFDRVTKFMCVCAWWFSPFAHVQTFHHFSYLFLPLYFVMGYTYFNLRECTGNGSAGTRRLPSGFLNCLLLFCCIFTGENTIPLLGMIILAFLIYGVKTKNSVIVKKYIGHLCLSIVLGISWIIVWKTKICTVDGGWFRDPQLSFSKLGSLIRECVKNLGYFLWLGPFRYGENWKSGISITDLLIVLICIMAIIYASYRCIQSYAVKKQEKISIYRFLAGAVISVLGMTIIYVMLNIFKGYALTARYFYTIYTVLTCIIVMLLNYIPSLRIRKIINIGIMLVLVGYNVFWYGILAPQYARRNWDVERRLEEICDQYDTIVVETEKDNPVYGKVIERGYYYRPKSAFSEAWATEALVNNYFETVIFVPEIISVEFDEKNVYLGNAGIWFQQQVVDSMTIDRENTCFMYLDCEEHWQVSDFSEFYNNKSGKAVSNIL